jgi:hypothetical protein
LPSTLTANGLRAIDRGWLDGSLKTGENATLLLFLLRPLSITLHTYWWESTLLEGWKMSFSLANESHPLKTPPLWMLGLELTTTNADAPESVRLGLSHSLT